MADTHLQSMPRRPAPLTHRLPLAIAQSATRHPRAPRSLLRAVRARRAPSASTPIRAPQKGHPNRSPTSLKSMQCNIGGRARNFDVMATAFGGSLFCSGTRPECEPRQHRANRRGHGRGGNDSRDCVRKADCPPHLAVPPAPLRLRQRKTERPHAAPHCHARHLLHRQTRRQHRPTSARRPSYSPREKLDPERKGQMACNKIGKPMRALRGQAGVLTFGRREIGDGLGHGLATPAGETVRTSRGECGGWITDAPNIPETYFCTSLSVFLFCAKPFASV